MASVIELNGYKVKIPNSIYFGRNLIKPADKQNLTFVPIVILKRYTEPSEDDVVNAAQVKALEFLEDSNKEPANYLEEIVKSFPGYILHDLVEDEKGCVDFIRRHTPAPKLEPGAKSDKVLQIAYGFGPPSISKLELSEIQIRKKLNNYGKKTGINMWGFEALLTLNDYMLPPRDLIDFLLNDRTLVANSLKVRLPHIRYYNKIASVLDSVYSGLPSEKEVQLIKDVTQEKREWDLIGALEDLKESVDEDEELVNNGVKKAVDNVYFSKFLGKNRFKKQGGLWGNN